MTDRLRRCLDQGSIFGLFPVLKDWPVSELTALLKDLFHFQEEQIEAIKQAWKHQAFRPENFFIKEMGAALDKARDEAAMDVVVKCSEIASVAMYYLPDEVPSDWDEQLAEDMDS